MFFTTIKSKIKEGDNVWQGLVLRRKVSRAGDRGCSAGEGGNRRWADKGGCSEMNAVRELDTGLAPWGKAFRADGIAGAEALRQECSQGRTRPM